MRKASRPERLSTAAFVAILVFGAFGTSLPTAVGVTGANRISSLGGGCSDDEAACVDHVVARGTDLSQPPVSFRGEVAPIFVNSCAFTGCHGRADAERTGAFLGVRPPAANDTDAVHAAIVDVPAPEITRMSLVTPGDPENSYLMRKMDGDHCLLNDRCRNGNCGDAMPRLAGLLPVATRDKVRRWIAQGAQKN